MKSIGKGNFTKGIIVWLLENNYQVGMPAKDMDVRKELEGAELLGKKIAERIIDELFEEQMLLISGGKISKENLSRLLLPFTKLSDVVGYDFARGSNLLINIFADELNPNEIERRITTFLEVGKPLRKGAGIRLQLRPHDLEIDLVLTYFDKAKCNSDMEMLMPKVSKYAVRTHIRVHTWYTNIPERKVLQGAKQGMFSGNWVGRDAKLGSLKGFHEAAKKVGGRVRGFYTEYLDEVLKYAN